MGIIYPPQVEIGWTYLPNIGRGASGPPASSPRFRHHWNSSWAKQSIRDLQNCTNNLFFKTFFSSAKKVDAKLRQWLKELDIDEPSIRKFADEDLSLHDVLHLMTRDDLTRLNLKLGPELRIWDKIVKDRKKP